MAKNKTKKVVVKDVNYYTKRLSAQPKKRLIIGLVAGGLAIAGLGTATGIMTYKALHATNYTEKDYFVQSINQLIAGNFTLKGILGEIAGDDKEFITLKCDGIDEYIEYSDVTSNNNEVTKSYYRIKNGNHFDEVEKTDDGTYCSLDTCDLDNGFMYQVKTYASAFSDFTKYNKIGDKYVGYFPLSSVESKSGLEEVYSKLNLRVELTIKNGSLSHCDLYIEKNDEVMIGKENFFGSLDIENLGSTEIPNINEVKKYVTPKASEPSLSPYVSALTEDGELELTGTAYDEYSREMPIELTSDNLIIDRPDLIEFDTKNKVLKVKDSIKSKISDYDGTIVHIKFLNEHQYSNECEIMIWNSKSTTRYSDFDVNSSLGDVILPDYCAPIKGEKTWKFSLYSRKYYGGKIYIKMYYKDDHENQVVLIDDYVSLSPNDYKKKVNVELKYKNPLPDDITTQILCECSEKTVSDDEFYLAGTSALGLQPIMAYSSYYTDKFEQARTLINTGRLYECTIKKNGSNYATYKVCGNSILITPNSGKPVSEYINEEKYYTVTKNSDNEDVATYNLDENGNNYSLYESEIRKILTPLNLTGLTKYSFTYDNSTDSYNYNYGYDFNIKFIPVEITGTGTYNLLSKASINKDGDKYEVSFDYKYDLSFEELLKWAVQYNPINMYNADGYTSKSTLDSKNSLYFNFNFVTKDWPNYFIYDSNKIKLSLVDADSKELLSKDDTVTAFINNVKYDLVYDNTNNVFEFKTNPELYKKDSNNDYSKFYGIVFKVDIKDKAKIPEADATATLTIPIYK